MLIPPHIKTLLDRTLENSQDSDLFEALVCLIEGSGDSSLINEVFARFPDDWIGTASSGSKQRAVDVLLTAEAESEILRWQTEHEADNERDAQASENVVDLFNGEPVRPDVQTEPDAPPAVTMDDIAGLSAVKQEVQRRIIRPFTSPDLYQRFRRKSGGGILLYGPPGCGKTMMAKAIAGACEARFVEVRPSEIFDRYWGVAEQRIETMFEQARQDAPCVLFFDEVECLTHRRGANSGGSAYKNDIISSILREMDGVGARNEGVLLLGATNVPWVIDPAFRRPGRFDRSLFVPPPDKVARHYLLTRLLDEKPTGDDIDYASIVQRTAGYSGADLEALVDGAVDHAIDESIENDGSVLLSARHFNFAFDEYSSSIGEWLALAKSYADHSSDKSQYKDLREFLKKFGRNIS